MPDLLTLAEYKTFAGVDPTDDRDDVRIESLLPVVGRAIASYTDRKFNLAGAVPQDRTFSYTGEGMLDIDDCTNITQVSTDAGVLGATYDLDATQWTANPGDDYPTFYYLTIHSGPFHSFSPEMGFERNLDKYDAPSAKPVSVTVNATWGWPEIPADVKLAGAWFIEDTLSKPGGDNLSAEGIEGYTRSWAGSFSSLALPNRARDLLVPYQRVF